MARQLTITLDDDVATLLETEAQRTGLSVDDTVNETVRGTLKARTPVIPKPFKVQARNMGVPLVDLECAWRALEILDELERK